MSKPDLDPEGKPKDAAGNSPQQKEKHISEEILNHPVVRDLRAIDDDYLELERSYQKELLALERKYEQRYAPILEKRRQQLAEDTGNTNGKVCGTPALPDFWKTVLQNSEEFQEVVEEYDEPVLEYLQDVTSEWIEPEGQTGFKLSFSFAANPYFTNTVLCKTYHTERRNEFIDSLDCVRIAVDTINWKEGKNVTVDVVSKKGKRKKQALKKKEELARPSFFRTFFRPLGPNEQIPEDERCEDDEEEELDVMQMLLADDHEQGVALRDNIIPHAVRWYTGEACEDEDDEAADDVFDEDEEEEEEDDEDDEDDDEGEQQPSKGKKPQKEASASKSDKEEDCKQQ